MKFFSQLIKEADGYMLGSHAAREGLPRGHAAQSAYANLGFYKRDPISDIKKGPQDVVPESVYNTIHIIINCFLDVFNQKKQAEVLNQLIPYIQDFEYFRRALVQHQRLLEVLASKRKRHEKLMDDYTNAPDDQDIAAEVKKIEDEITKLEQRDAAFEAEITKLNKELEEWRPSLQEEVIDTIAEICKGTVKTVIEPKKVAAPKEGEVKEEKPEPDHAKNIKDAFHRYCSLVLGRREDVRGSLSRSYLLLDPIVSFQRFYNNALSIYRTRIERENDKVKTYASTGAKGKNVLKGAKGVEMVNFLVDCMDNITRLRSKKAKPDLLKQHTEFAQKAYRHIAELLEPTTRIKLALLMSNFLADYPMSEGKLKHFLLIDVQKELKIIK